MCCYKERRCYLSPHGLSFKAVGSHKDFHCILKAGVFSCESLDHLKMSTARHLADLQKPFVVADSDKVGTKEGWRNKQKVFRGFLECPPLKRVRHSLHTHSFHCDCRSREAQGINHGVSEWAV